MTMASPIQPTAVMTLATPFRDAGASDSTSIATSTLRTTKRKLDDAFQSLDNAVASPDIQRPSPPKRAHTMRSLYSTLAKYGVKGKESHQEPQQTSEEDPTVAKSAPRLTAILARAATRTRKALPFKFSGPSTVPQLPATADYRPSSLPAFLARLATFKLSTYANKPPVIDAVAASKCGWTNDGKDRLVCGLCRASWVVAGRDGMSRDAGNALLERQRASLVDMHKDGCPWKARQCDPTIYCIPLQSPAAMVKNIKINATTLDPWLRNIEIKHPLTSTQLTSLQSTLAATAIPSDTPQTIPNPDTSDVNQDIFLSPLGDQTVGPSSAAILTSLFGWSLAPTIPVDPARRPSLTRTNSLTCSPSFSRGASGRSMSPAPLSSQGEPTTSSHILGSQFTFRMSSNVGLMRDTLLHCVLCQRRIGLWAFSPESSKSMAEKHHTTLHGSNDTDITMESTRESVATSVFATPTKKGNTQRPFDVLKEHRAYCPYVVRSTIIPTLPTPPNSSTASSNALSRSNSVSAANSQSSALEGWRALLTVLLRHGVGQRQRLGLDFVDRLRRNAVTDESMEVDGIKAMVAGVKKRGGKDLLRYVKGLLG